MAIYLYKLSYMIIVNHFTIHRSLYVSRPLLMFRFPLFMFSIDRHCGYCTSLLNGLLKTFSSPGLHKTMQVIPFSCL